MVGGDTATVRELLAHDFRFYLLGNPMGGKEQFLDAAAFPPQAMLELQAEAYGDEIGFQMYLALNGDKKVIIVEALKVADGRILQSTLVTDMAAFQSFLAG